MFYFVHQTNADPTVLYVGVLLKSFDKMIIIYLMSPTWPGTIYVVTAFRRWYLYMQGLFDWATFLSVIVVFRNLG